MPKEHMSLTDFIVYLKSKWWGEPAPDEIQPESNIENALSMVELFLTDIMADEECPSQIIELCLLIEDCLHDIREEIDPEYDRSLVVHDHISPYPPKPTANN